MLNSKRIYFIPVIGFFIIIMVASLLLFLPISNNKPIEYKDALFVSTSAVSTTGLSTVVVTDQFNFFGQLIIAVLMEIGAYGFIVIVSYIWSVRNKRISFSNMILINDSISSNDFKLMKEHLLFIGKLMLKVQIWGAIFYAIKFIPRFDLLNGIWYSIFHSISAFSNGGFDIINFYYFKDDIYIQIVTIVLMFLGSLGILVIEDIKNNKSRKFNRLKLQTQIVLAVSIVVIIVPSIIMTMIEPNCNIINSAFITISSRSTGFVVYQMNLLSVASRVMLIILMLIGGGPASTSGGIRILPFSIVGATIIATLKGQNQTILFNKKIPEFLIKKSFVIVTLFIVILFILISLFYTLNNIGLENIIFECVSAATNTGFSVSDYSQINFAGELILIILMFIGRVGPLSIFLVFLKEDHKGSFIEYPEGNIVI